MSKIRGAKLLEYFGIERENAIWAGLSKKIAYGGLLWEIGPTRSASVRPDIHYGKTDARKR